MGEKVRFYVDIHQFFPEVTGSKTLCVVHLHDGSKVRLLVDAGLFEEKKHQKYNDELLFNPENVDCMLITHVHVDHIGTVPFLVRKGYRQPIYCTNTTAELMPIALNDCYKVLSSNYRHAKRKCLYDDDNVADTLKLIKGCPYNESIQVHPNVKVTFFENGHLFGAAMILIQISDPGYEDINLLFTGDYNNENTFFDVEPLPDWVKDLPLTVITESTYGNRVSTDVCPCFRENVENCLKKKGTVIALAFSLGRTQEILYELKCMQKEGILDPNIPIYLDGKLGINYTLKLNDSKEKYGIKPEMQDFLPENLSFVFKEIRQFVLYSGGPKIIVTSSGMGSYGPAQMYIPVYIERKKALIQFTGYCAKGTLGAQLHDAEKKKDVSVAGTKWLKKADVEFTKEFSAHAKSDELINLLKQFTNLKVVIICHGETKTKQEFSEKVLKEVSPKDIEIPGRDYVVRVSHYGLVKLLPTKFDK